MRVFELRKYELYEGAFDAMVERVEAINKPLFAEYGIDVEHMWVDPDDHDVFFFVFSFDTRADRDSAWKAYHEDERFIAAREEQAKIIKKIELHVLDPLAGSRGS